MTTPIKLGQNKISDSDNLSVGNKKSENGGNSTNLSEGSNDTFDEEFNHKKGDKFEFINEKSENWPQWSVSQQQQTDPQV